MATQVQITFNDEVWLAFLALQPGATDAEKLAAAKQAIKREYVRPRVLNAAMRAEQETNNVRLRTFAAELEARLID